MIIKHTLDNRELEVYNLQYPDPLVSETKKRTKDYIKNTLDYFWNLGVTQVMGNKNSFGKNYDLVKGTLRPEDFYENEELPGFYETEIEKLKANPLPSFVQDFSIIMSPLNILKGEYSRRPENILIKAVDDDSQAEELQFRTDTLKQFVSSKIASNIMMKAAQEGTEFEEGQLEEMTAKEVEEKLSNYTSHVERWATRTLDALRLKFSMKEKSEEAFDDLLKVARERFHVYEDSSKLGFNVEVLNPVNVFELTTPGKKYISDPLDEPNGAYAAGFINVMELSEINHRYSLTKEEMDHLQKLTKEALPLGGETSNLFIPSAVGQDSIKYHTYNRARLEEKMFIDSYLNDNPYSNDIVGFNSASNVYGNKFTVMQIYWSSQIRIGKLTYIDVDEQVVTIPVDESYRDGDHPTQISIVWGYVKQWWKGTRIGCDVYKDVEPFQLLEYCPILGVVYEPKNLTKIKSFVDMLKPFQTICNIYMNKLYEMIQKDMGTQILTSIRHVPKAADGTHQDALDQFIEKARAEGIIFLDDSPTNMGGSSGFNQHTVLQASRVNEMQGYFNLYQMIKLEAWALVGINPQRQGEVQATQTATGTNTAMTQSYSQTEPWFAQHEYFMNKVYQAILDAAQHITAQKPESTLSYITNEFDSGAIQIMGEGLNSKDFWVFVSSRSEDAANLFSLKQLSQSMLQNGASPYDVMLMTTSKSTRYVQDAFKRADEQRKAMEQQNQQLEQQKLQQEQQQFQQAQELAVQQAAAQQENDNFNKEMDRQSKERIALIGASSAGNVTPPDADASGISDVYELDKINIQRQKAEQDHANKQRDLALKQMEILNRNANAEADRDLKREELDVKREDIEAKKYVARINKNPGSSKK